MTLVLGHASSGKSAWAEGLARRLGGQSVYFATTRLLDDEMRAKVEIHQRRRGLGWEVLEVPVGLARAVRARRAGETVLIDCATMWLTNLVMDGIDWEPAAREWIEAMGRSPARFVTVSNDVGGGVVPENALARRFQRAQGELNQMLAAAAGRAVLVTAGLPLALKGDMP